MVIYNITKDDNDIKIFGSEFVENNNNIYKLIIDNKEYKITKNYKIKDDNKNILKIKLKGINNVTNMSFMFYECSSLLSLPDISKSNTNNISNLSYMFYECSSLLSLPDITKWNTSNITDMSFMFYGRTSFLIFQNGIQVI